MMSKANYIIIIFLAYLTTFSHQKLLANNSIQEDNKQASTKIDNPNRHQTNIKAKAWLEIIKQNKGDLSPQELALIKSKIASTFFQAGNYQEAVRHWRSALEFYHDNQQSKDLAANLNNLAQAYLGMGQTLLAEKKLNEAIEIAKQEKLDNILHSAYLIFGNIHKIRAKYLDAEINFDNSLKYASSPEEKIAVYQNLSQLFYIQFRKLRLRTQNIATEYSDIENIDNQGIGYLDKAWSTANIAIELSNNIDSLAAVDTHLQLLQLGSEIKDFQPHPYLNKAETILSNLHDSTRKVYALIKLSEFKQNPVPLLKQATEIAKNLEDDRAASFGLGRLGRYHEQKKQYSEALGYTNKAIQAASQAQNEQSLYQWYWQAGRIHSVLNQTQPAIDGYNQAIASLQEIRTELARSNNIDFSREIEPVYRELLSLLLSNNPTPENIEQALKIRDLLQLSELENFFRDDCLELFSGQDKLLPNQTGLIFTIILPEATHVILKQGQQTTSIKIDIPQSQLEELVQRWRYSLEDRAEEDYLSLSQKMYTLLIKPLESELTLNQPDTLIFINDGILKNVPMAALYDGKNFLVENYTISISLSLNLRIRANQSLPQKKQLLAFGLSEATKGFSALPYVKQEIQSISKFIKVKQILNTKFIIDKVKKELIKNNYPIVHFATHGKFGGTLEDSFLKTYQGQIGLTDLISILNQHQLTFPNNPVNLLVLSACETAASNKRSTLGLAGIAIRSGVHNSVGSLWSVSDHWEVDLIEYFYNSLIRERLSPDQALRQAKIKMIGNKLHPSIWSNLILIAS